MKKSLLCSVFVLGLVAVVSAAPGKGKVYADPVKAAEEDADFLVQGEYAGEDVGVQVVAMGNGAFSAMLYDGGLPGAGWDGVKTIRFAGTADELPTAEGGFNMVLAGGHATMTDAKGKKWFTIPRVERKSPTLGAKPPAGSVVLFDGSDTARFKNGKMENGLLKEGTETLDKFGDFQLHIEFRTPYKPHAKPGSQDRGNSGVYIFNNYETQILDSFGIKPEYNYCGSLYRFKTTDVNMCFPPLAWQTYDIRFTAPRFEGDKKVKNARITTKHNGVTIHDDVELPHGTGAGKGRPEKEKGPFILQGHGNPVRFRNIWIKETTK